MHLQKHLPHSDCVITTHKHKLDVHRALKYLSCWSFSRAPHVLSKSSLYLELQVQLVLTNKPIAGDSMSFSSVLHVDLRLTGLCVSYLMHMFSESADTL